MSHLPEIFGRIAAIHPGRIALDIPPGRGRTSRNTVTYSKLQSMSLAIGHAIKECATVAPDSIVAILLPRDTESLYAAQLGVLNIGAAFTCLDPLFPDEHNRSVLNDADAVVILDFPTFSGHYSTARETSSRVPGEPREPTITYLSHGTV